MTTRDLLNRALGAVGYRLEKRSRERLDGSDLHNDLAIILKDKPGALIIDAGAHQGHSVRHFLKDFRRPEIISFEPTPQSLEVLRQRYGNRPCVRIVPAALGEKDGHGELHLYERSQMNSLFPLESPEHLRRVEADLAVLEKVSVEIRSLDSFTKENDLPSIDILKMDCQGAEMSILRGATRLLTERRISCIYLEVLFQGLYVSQASFEEYRAFLAPYGFVLTGFYRPTFRNNALFHADVLFVRN